MRENKKIIGEDIKLVKKEFTLKGKIMKNDEKYLKELTKIVDQKIKERRSAENKKRSK